MFAARTFAPEIVTPAKLAGVNARAITIKTITGWPSPVRRAPLPALTSRPKQSQATVFKT